MAFVSYRQESEQVGTVLSIIQNPLPEMISDEGEFIEGVLIPDREDIPGMDAYLRINLKTKGLYYDYILRETFETKVSALQQENSELKQAIADLTATLAAVMAG